MQGQGSNNKCKVREPIYYLTSTQKNSLYQYHQILFSTKEEEEQVEEYCKSLKVDITSITSCLDFF